MILCAGHAHQSYRWRTTNVCFGRGYDPDIGTIPVPSDGEDPMAYRRRAVENRRALIRRQLTLIREAHEAGRGCTIGPRTQRGPFTTEDRA